jgi:hypothetical protein
MNALVYASDSISPDMKPPPISDGTPNESVADVFVRVTQLMSILETLVNVSPDSDNLSILQAGLIGLDLRRVNASDSSVISIPLRFTSFISSNKYGGILLGLLGILC